MLLFFGSWSRGCTVTPNQTTTKPQTYVNKSRTGLGSRTQEHLNIKEYLRFPQHFRSALETTKHQREVGTTASWENKSKGQGRDLDHVWPIVNHLWEPSREQSQRNLKKTATWCLRTGACVHHTSQGTLSSLECLWGVCAENHLREVWVRGKSFTRVRRNTDRGKDISPSQSAL